MIKTILCTHEETPWHGYRCQSWNTVDEDYMEQNVKQTQSHDQDYVYNNKDVKEYSSIEKGWNEDWTEHEIRNAQSTCNTEK